MAPGVFPAHPLFSPSTCHFTPFFPQNKFFSWVTAPAATLPRRCQVRRFPVCAIPDKRCLDCQVTMVTSEGISLPWQGFDGCAPVNANHAAPPAHSPCSHPTARTPTAAPAKLSPDGEGRRYGRHACQVAPLHVHARREGWQGEHTSPVAAIPWEPLSADLEGVKPVQVICSWCGRERQEDGSYGLPAPSSQGEPVSHGICPDCRSAYFPEIPPFG